MEKDNLNQEAGIKSEDEQYCGREPLEMLYFALSIFSLSLGVYFIKKHN
jgi:hypothetical protein